MIKITALVLCCVFFSCSSKVEKSPLLVKTVLAPELKEISGITAVGGNIWAITDKPRARFFKLDATGKLLQTVNITNTTGFDVEAVTSDSTFIYVGDVGDNIGDRVDRKIIKVALAKIPNGTDVQVMGDTINFTFPQEKATDDKKQNNFDCESVMSFKDSLYLFTKDREDKESKLYVIPKVPGRYIARYISTFNTDGLVTDAAVNPANNEIALIGYHKGHLYPFMYLLSNFDENDFFSGDQQKIELANKPWNWQLEGITYNSKNNVYFSCEGTKEVPATLYAISRNDIFKLKKEKDKKDDKKDKKDDDDDGPELSKKGHLKM